MPDFLKNIEWSLAIPVLLALMALIISIYNFVRRKIADNRIIATLRSDQKNVKQFIGTLESLIQESDKKIKELNKAFENPNETSQELLLQKQALIKQYEDFKLHLIKEQVNAIAQNLKRRDKDEILKTISSASTEGEKNYLEKLINKSGILPMKL